MIYLFQNVTMGVFILGTLLCLHSETFPTKEESSLVYLFGWKEMSMKWSCRAAVVACFALALVFAGCDCEGTNVSGFPKLDVSPTEGLIFPSIPVDDKATRVVTIKSTGQAEVRISSIKIAEEVGGQAYTLLDVDQLTFPLVLQPTEERKLTVQYQPRQAGSASALIHIASDASNTDIDGLVKVRLRASNVGGFLSSPNPLDFGAVPKGEEKVKDLVLENLGNATVTITGVTFQRDVNKQFSLAEALPNNLTIKGKEKVTLKVKFVPTSPVPSEADMFINMAEGDPEKIRVIGRMALPTLEVTPTELVYRDVKIGESQALKLTIANKGDATAEISELAFGKDDSPPFSLTNPPTLPLKIETGKQIELTVAYNAADADAASGVLTIKSNDPNRPSIPVTLTANPKGCVIGASTQELVFPSPGKLEIALSNTGTSPCDLKSLGIEPSDASAFTISDGAKAGDKIQPNGKVSVEIQYKETATPEKDSANLKVVSDATNTPTLLIPIRSQKAAPAGCELTISPTVLQFGFVGLGQSKKLAVDLKNTSSSSCTLKSALVKDPRFLFALQTSVPGVGLPIAAGQTLKLEVSFTPANSQSAQAIMELVTSDPKTPNATITLLGASGDLCLEVQPNPVDFGQIKQGCGSIEQELIIRNTCNSAIRINRLSWQTGTTQEFRFTAGGLPTDLAPSASYTATVRYKPTNLGQDLGVLQIEHNRTSQSPTTTVVQGEGVQTDERKEVFTQKNQPKIDVLFVIDDSNSMKDKQESLSTNLQSFIQWASKLQADYQIAITTTDTDCDSTPGSRYKLQSSGICTRPTRPSIPQAGCIRGTPKVLTPQTPNLLGTFAQNVKVGLQGSGQEKGIFASYLALQPDRLRGCNKGFLRTDASLSIIYVSDEPDSSPDPVDDYVKFFLSLKGGRADLVRASSIVGPPPSGCNVNGFRVKSAPDYWDIATKLKGVKDSICSNNWANTLSQIGALTFGQQREFFLKSPAEESTIVVKVDGRVVAKGSSGWSYDANNYSILFASSAVPDAGKQIEVTYRAKCLP